MIKKIIITIAILILTADIIGFGEYRKNFLFGKISSQIKDQIKIAAIDKEGLENRIGELENQLQAAKNQNEAVLDSSKTVLEQIGAISNTVGTLDKLSKADPELLAKYSKTYFLSEHYVPVQLTGVNPAFTYIKDKILKIHSGVFSHLEKLFEEAKKEGLNLGAVSAYRSFSEQSVLKSAYKFTYGTGTANQFSAEQGYSEHQLGTAVDFATPATADKFSGFNKTPEYVWLINKAHKYGFILSYPQTNPYYQYEPWHWRFVGVDLATKLYDASRYFYDFDQREINTYLANMFD